MSVSSKIEAETAMSTVSWDRSSTLPPPPATIAITITTTTITGTNESALKNFGLVSYERSRCQVLSKQLKGSRVDKAKRLLSGTKKQTTGTVRILSDKKAWTVD